MEPNQGYNAEYPLVPLIPDLIHRLAEERIRIEREKHQLKQEIIRADVKLNSESATSSSVILKIPSYKPSSKSPDNASSNQNNSTDDAQDHGAAKGNDASSVDLEYDSEDPVVAKKAKEDASGKLCTSADSSSSEASSEKKSNSLIAKQKRPKRGRYRNYNRDSLIEAVRAVQRGEMSVHRAGSFYGVPHSTLEYKVKERHLLRPRKRDKLVTIQPTPNRKEAKVASTNQNGLAVNSTSAVVGNQGTPVTLFPPLDFNQLAAANQFFASQMMRKLQEDAIMHADEGQESRESPSEPLFGELIKSDMDQLYSSSGKPSNPTTISFIATKTGAK